MSFLSYTPNVITGSLDVEVLVATFTGDYGDVVARSILSFSLWEKCNGLVLLFLLPVIIIH